MNLTTATPVEIDTVLAEIEDRKWTALVQLHTAQQHLADYVDGNVRREAGDMRYSGYNERAIARATEKVEAAKAALAAIREEARPLNDEFDRRGGWTRAFLVMNSNGHVHSSMNCSTTFVRTRFAWLPSLSGHTEAEIVEAAGSDACTVCYPSAPVEALSRPRSVFSAEEQVERKSREQRAAEKAERQAKKIAKALTPDGSEFVVKVGTYVSRRDNVTVLDETESFKTEQAAMQWAVERVVNFKAYGYNFSAQKQAAVAEILAAVQAKHGLTDEALQALFDKKVEAKIKREKR